MITNWNFRAEYLPISLRETNLRSRIIFGGPSFRVNALLFPQDRYLHHDSPALAVLYTHPHQGAADCRHSSWGNVDKNATENICTEYSVHTWINAMWVKCNRELLIFAQSTHMRVNYLAFIVLAANDRLNEVAKARKMQNRVTRNENDNFSAIHFQTTQF